MIAQVNSYPLARARIHLFRHHKTGVNPIRERLGALYYRLFGRCWACHGLMALHSPGQVRRCENTPLAIALTDSEPVGPASQASA